MVSSCVISNLHINTFSGSDKRAIVESDPSQMFKYDADLDTISLTSTGSCTFDGEIVKKVSLLTLC